ncbi:MAG: hypothetical protein HY296_00375 [Thaumarchaeota archaeon]|nr:hypothetical protein [Nitrososphaerota archaeon]
MFVTVSDRVLGENVVSVEVDVVVVGSRFVVVEVAVTVFGTVGTTTKAV